jgi:hypothetical protein
MPSAKLHGVSLRKKCNFNCFSLNYENNNYQADGRCQLLAGTRLQFGASLHLTASISLLFEVQVLAPSSGYLSKEIAPAHLVKALFAFYEIK